jgi:hypothetical protein
MLSAAPHSHHLLLEGDWARASTIGLAFFPLYPVREDKYWRPPLAAGN